MKLPYRFEPRDYQKPAFTAIQKGIKRMLLVWHRRGGKDLVCWNILICEALKKRGIYFYAFPEKQQGMKAIWNNIHDDMTYMDHIPPGFIVKKSDQQASLTLKNGSIIYLVGLDKAPDKIRGVKANGVVISEAAYCDPYLMQIFGPSVREAKGFIIFNSTPNGRNWVFDMYRDRKKDRKWFVSLQTAKDTGTLNEEALEEALKELGDKDIFDQEYMCSWSVGARGSIYEDQIQKAYDEKRVGPFAYDPSHKVDTFWDLGRNDDTVIWFRQQIGNKLIFVDYYENRGEHLQHYIDILANKGYNYGTHYLPFDADSKSFGTSKTARVQMEELLRSYKLSDDCFTVERSRSVQEDIQGVRARFGRYYFNESYCKEALEKLRMYHRRYDFKNKVYRPEPVHDWSSHCADALRIEATSVQYSDDWEYGDEVTVLNDYHPFDKRR